jgi:hypothetical protein
LLPSELLGDETLLAENVRGKEYLCADELPEGLTVVESAVKGALFVIKVVRLSEEFVTRKRRKIVADLSSDGANANAAWWHSKYKEHTCG